MVRSQKGGMVQKMFGPQERRGKSAERSEKRETSTITISRSMDVIGSNGSIPEGRDGREKGRPLGEKREERREKREEKDKHDYHN